MEMETVLWNKYSNVFLLLYVGFNFLLLGVVILNFTLVNLEDTHPLFIHSFITTTQSSQSKQVIKRYTYIYKSKIRLFIPYTHVT